MLAGFVDDDEDEEVDEEEAGDLDEGFGEIGVDEAAEQSEE